MKHETRNSGFELLRIVCMLMIIGGHIIMQHKTAFDVKSADFTTSLFMRGAFAVAVNAFILISGYFGINFKWKRLLKLEMQTLFYSVLLLGVAIGLGWHTINLRKDILLFFPVLSKQYWFITCYAVLYIISPLLNQWVASMDKATYRRLLVAGAGIIYVWPTVSFLFAAPQFINDSGYGIINFSYLYLLGYYLRHHYSDGLSANKYWGGYFCVIILLFLAQYGLSSLLGFEFTSWISYNTIFGFGGSICIFLAFKNMTFHSTLVNNIAKPCLAVYLIHLHPCIWSGFCEAIGVSCFHGYRYLLLICVLPIVVYIACAIIENIRTSLFGKVEEGVISFVGNKVAKCF